MAESNIKVLTLQVDTGTGTIKVNGIKNSIEGATKAMNEFNATAAKTSVATKDLGSSAGLAGATVNEFGRFISDLPYGITAVTNNISQLGSLFAILVTKTGSVNAAIKSLGATLKASPALVALLAFQVAVAALESFAQSAKKAKKGSDELASSIGSAASNLRIAKKALEDENVSSSEKQKIISAINLEYKDLNLKLGSNNKLTEESSDAIEKEIQSIRRRTKARAIEKLIQDEQEKIAISESKGFKESLSFLEKSLVVVQSGLSGTIMNLEGNMMLAGKAIRDGVVGESIKTIDKLTDILKGEGLIDLLFDGSIGKDKKKKRIQVFKQFLLDFSKEAESIRQDSLRDQLITEREKIKIDRANAEAEIELAYFVYLEKRQIKLDEFLAGDADSKQKLNAQKKYDEEEVVALQQLVDVKNQIRAKETTDNNILNRKEFENARDNDEQIAQINYQIVFTKRQVRIDDIKSEILFQQKLIEASEKGTTQRSKHELQLARLREELRLKEISDIIEIAEFANQQLSVATDFLNSEFQRQISIEQNKTTALNNELNQRLRNENISAEERQNIQNQIALNDESLRLKQEKIEKKRFAMQKAANIATSIMNTFVAANSVLAQQPGGIISKTAAMVAVIATGLLNVASIARQQFQGSLANAGGAFGNSNTASSGVQAPDFNIVGASPTNQIANAISENERKPIKAYVVSKDVSSAQEMDRNIIGVASLG